MAEVQNSYSNKVVAIASCLPCGGDDFLRELERAVLEDGLRGVLSHRATTVITPMMTKPCHFSSLLRGSTFP